MRLYGMMTDHRDGALHFRPSLTASLDHADEVTELRLADTGITSVVWCIGFRHDFRWIEVPVFNGRGVPSHARGTTSTPGLHFLGLPWQWTWGSGRLSGVGADAEHLAERIRSQRGLTATGPRGGVRHVLALGS